MRERPEDIAKEEKIFKVLNIHFKSEHLNFPSNQGKYRIDGYLHNQGEMVRWVECKWLNGEGFMGLNVAKYMEGCNLALTTGVPFIYAFRSPGKVGFITVHDGLCSESKTKIKRVGGTPKGRDALWDDIEPMMMFVAPSITWIINDT